MIINCLFGSIWTDENCSIVTTDCTFNTETKEISPEISTEEPPIGELLEEYISICILDLPEKNQLPLLLSIHPELDKLIGAVMSGKKLTNFDDAVIEVCQECHEYILPCPECEG